MLVQLVHIVNAFCRPRFASEKFPQVGVRYFEKGSASPPAHRSGSGAPPSKGSLVIPSRAESESPYTAYPAT
jgi:hypothetical protein